MFGYMKCIRTGCDVKYEKMIFHGDLFYKKGYLILSGVPKNNGVLNENSDNDYFDFETDELFEIPSSGNYYSSFALTGNIFNVNSKLLEMFKEYESLEIVEKFSK